MGSVKVGNEVYGWGDEAQGLADDPEALGARLLGIQDASNLEDALNAAGFEPAFEPAMEMEQGLEGSELFLIVPKFSRRPVRLEMMQTEKLWVREKPLSFVRNTEEATEEVPPRPEETPTRDLTEEMQQLRERIALPGSALDAALQRADDDDADQEKPAE